MVNITIEVILLLAYQLGFPHSLQYLYIHLFFVPLLN